MVTRFVGREGRGGERDKGVREGGGVGGRGGGGKELEEMRKRGPWFEGDEDTLASAGQDERCARGGKRKC